MFSKVKVWEEQTIIPTYKVGRPDKNPMFLEKRVYQGSSGRVYPHTVTDKIYDEKEDREYTALFLENDFIKIMVLPELGGRIQRATDKTNGYDFVYYNHVIKPALVGLAGPWISGGIEFNWPQHHRPSTFDPVDYTYRENDDGSATVAVGEIENMFETKCTAEFTLYPDRTYIEIKVQIFNRTNIPQTFLWWANPAVSVNDNTRTIFPPDVTAVMDHGKRDVSTFPIAKGTYYKVDYSKGVDISRYKNLPVPTSYMAAESDDDFVGGYDDGVQAGILHIADHHISPGKKQWTWGCGDFGKAWDRNLTDSDGPYVELMTGCFTDNQPDFSWLAPMEERRFTQYFMPYQKLGTVHNATKDLAIHIENSKAALYATGNIGEISVKLISNSATNEKILNMGPTDYIELDIDDSGKSGIEVFKDGHLYLSYYTDSKKKDVPSPATPPSLPEDCETNEDLYLYGLHIEQYRHATYNPDYYYIEGLRRDKYDSRINNAYGLRLFKQGRFKDAQIHFERAISRLTRSNPNPYDSEAYCNLGLCLMYQGELASAYNAFYKSAWSSSCQESAFYHMACICSRNGNYTVALEHIEEALIKNSRNYKALNVKVYLLDKTGRYKEAERLACDILKSDSLNYLAKLYLDKKITVNDNTAVELAIEMHYCGNTEGAVELLKNQNSNYPLVYYYLAYYTGDGKYLERARGLSPFGCFPHRLEDIFVLDNEHAADRYYLGCLYYDKRRYDDAIKCFEYSCEKNPDFPTAHRNLALLYYNKRHDVKKAVIEMEKAFSHDESDMRVLLELDNLYKLIGALPQKRLEFLEKHIDKIEYRDDLYLEYISLLNLTGRPQLAYEKIMSRKFHPWEGGEGKVPAQYIMSLCMIGGEQALLKTLTYPENLGEGKLYNSQENLQYFLLGKATGKREYFEKASIGLCEPNRAVFYNDQPPETIFCQGMALLELGKINEANSRFDSLISYGNEHKNDEIKIDYFAVSLPEFTVFDADLNKNNYIHCLFMEALGYLGKGEKSVAERKFDELFKLNPSNSQVHLYKTLFLGE